MNLADVSTVIFIIVGLLLVFVAWWLAVAGLFPRLVEGCAEKLGAAPLVCWLIGLGCAVPLIVGGIVLGNAMPSAAGNIIRGAIILVTIFAALTGTAGLALRIGRGLPAARDASDPWRRVLRGSVVLALTYLTIIWLPLTLLAGLGAVVRLGFSRRSASAPHA
ncbi:MAG: hypothetical protein JNK23_24035 [Opitutaceae bacterium]|nr:hypothetical protein [Opitutaceae bacterium]